MCRGRDVDDPNGKESSRDGAAARGTLDGRLMEAFQHEEKK